MDLPGFLKALALAFAVIGGLFWKLALRHNKNPIIFAIIGIASYYAGAFIGGVIITAVVVASGNIAFTESEFMNWVGVPVGIFACWLTYYLLKKNWSKNAG